MYKQRIPLSQRVIESAKIKEKFPGKIPIIVEKAQKVGSDIPNINKNKYLVPNTLSFGQFIYVIRKQLQLNPDKALFIFVNNTLVPASEMIGEIYNNHRDTDGFLYMVYSGESTFGGVMKYRMK
jgi:GABA(A) receptor-associated protein